MGNKFEQGANEVELLSLSLTALLDLSHGYPEDEIAFPSGAYEEQTVGSSGMAKLAAAIAIHLARMGALDEQSALQIQERFPDLILPKPETESPETKREMAMQAIASAHLTYADCIEALGGVESSEDPYALAANRKFVEGSDCDIELDDQVIVNESDKGAWVSAWLYVTHEEADEISSEQEVQEGGPWVIYHPGQPSDQMFWSNKNGWTTLSGATRFADQPPAPYPFGGGSGDGLATQSQPLCIGTMLPFTVRLSDPSIPDEVIRFDCFAESDEHAIEQAENAYPNDEKVISVSLTELLGNKDAEEA